ncbi:flagellar hook-associated protein 3 [Alicyclobacillus acidoterrestris]|uniref:flagellar hook-associated protein FlgL n=1 Tax=Alicyclobacillus suci TaxID=2816080 RepID=UPI001191EE29|nr:flagellar hook-associated protein FlgL [Alicyclobacillus suci]GEO26653.1 flagellar hook-associated protein 3 [Alicyclobacillus acidoterrestris]
MRVTQGMLSSQILSDIQNNYQQLSTLQNESATGHKINAPSDDPIGVQQVIQLTNETSFDSQYEQNATNAQAQLNFVSSTMTEAQNLLSNARDLALQGANSTETPSDMQAIAAEVGQLYNQMVTIGNTQYNGQYIFNGQDTDTPPYPPQAANLTPDQATGDLDPSTKVTNSGKVYVSLGNGVTLPVSASGSDFFQAAPSDSSSSGASSGSSQNAFSLLSQLYTALNNGDTTQVGNLVSGIDSVLDNMNQQQANVGSLINRAEMMQTRMSNLSDSVTKQLSNVQDADMATVLTQLNSAMAVQEASLEVGAQALPQTLVNFLK